MDMNDVFETASAIDEIAYAKAKEQAEAIYEILMNADDCAEMTITLGNVSIPLTITHTDVLNEIYCMLQNLMNLG